MGLREGAPHSVIYMAIYHLLIIKDLNNIIHTVGPFCTYLESLVCLKHTFRTML